MISIGYGFFIVGQRRIILEWKTIFLSLECRMPYNFIVRVLTITRGKYFRDKSQLVTQVYY